MISKPQLLLQRYNPIELYDPAPYAYTHVVRVSLQDLTEVIHISGQGGEYSSGVLATTFEQQCDGVFKNIQHCLTVAQIDWHNIAQMRILVVDHNRQKHTKLINVMQRYFNDGLYPACTLVPVPVLALPNMLLEIEVTAYRFKTNKNIGN